MILKNSSFWHFNSHFVLKTKRNTSVCYDMLRISDEFFDMIIGDQTIISAVETFRYSDLEKVCG